MFQIFNNIGAQKELEKCSKTARKVLEKNLKSARNLSGKKTNHQSAQLSQITVNKLLVCSIAVNFLSFSPANEQSFVCSCDSNKTKPTCLPAACFPTVPNATKCSSLKRMDILGKTQMKPLPGNIDDTMKVTKPRPTLTQLRL